MKIQFKEKKYFEYWHTVNTVTVQLKQNISQSNNEFLFTKFIKYKSILWAQKIISVGRIFDL